MFKNDFELLYLYFLQINSVKLLDILKAFLSGNAVFTSAATRLGLKFSFTRV